MGGDNITVFTGSLPTNVPLGGRMDIFLDSIFNYDSSLGNLLLSIQVVGVSAGSGSVYFDMSTSTVDSMSRQYGGATDTFGLVTGFNEDVASVPEPATLALFGLALFGLGLAGLGFARRKKKSA